jgi:hypothetical protein
MKKIIGFIWLCTLLITVQAQTTDIYKMSVGKQYLTHFSNKVDDTETFVFKAHKGSKFDIIVSSTEPAVLSTPSMTITLNGKEDKEFTLTGGGEVITLVIKVASKASVLIGVYLDK